MEKMFSMLLLSCKTPLKVYMGELEKAVARGPEAFIVSPNFHSCFY